MSKSRVSLPLKPQCLLHAYLHSGCVDEDLGCGVVDPDGLEDGGAVVGDLDLPLVPAHPPQDLVHPLRAQRRLDEVADGHGAHERREAGHLRLLLVGLVLQHSDRVQGDLQTVCNLLMICDIPHETGFKTFT